MITFKSIFKTILYFIKINAYIIFFHFMAFIGMAFNDSGDTLTIIEFLISPFFYMILAPMILISIFLTKDFSKKKDVSKVLLYLLQTLLILSWIKVYFETYISL